MGNWANTPISKQKSSELVIHQLFGAPLSIQQIIEFFCAVDSVLPCGMVPVETAERIALRALNTSE
jgi:hypothetical protein